jgi:LPS-assembly lipoprotein
MRPLARDCFVAPRLAMTPTRIVIARSVATKQSGALLALAIALPALLSGCGWRPLYADAQTGVADAELRAIRVDPIAERTGQELELALRNLFNPNGIDTPQRYELKTTLAVARSELGIQSQGLATRSKIDGYATFVLSELKTGKQLFKDSTHSFDTFDVEPSGYATVVNDNDARERVAEELSREIAIRLTLFLQRRAAEGAKAS